MSGEAEVTAFGLQQTGRLTGLEKGLPGPGYDGPDLSSVARANWNLLRGDLPLPVCTLGQKALEHNSKRMLRFLQAFAPNIVLCPHGKTTMSPQLFQRQLADGCWGISLATFHQVRAARRRGFERIFYANELVGPQEIAFVLQELGRDPAFDFYCLVDSIDGVERLRRSAEEISPRRPLQVLVEGGFPGGRCGVRTVEAALDVARAAHASSPHLWLVGLEGYEGVLQTKPKDERQTAVPSFLDALVEMIQACDSEGLFNACDQIMLSAGGSSFYDLVADVPRHLELSKRLQVVVRSGCYLTHDSGLYARLFEDLKQRSDMARMSDLSFEPALEIWCHVLSTPELDRIVLGAGQRDFGHDAGPPVILKTAQEGVCSRLLDAGAY
ncbi:alanine racemase [Mesorhizobium sp. LCM 4577]|uniref:alanine racemase n=1 Tax=Mesorhizobium sp. LCM 4577 TaxID=1848288 RepID=UPI0009F3AC1A|nr:alanine racemase [Mesorhizobium sp. LCM 4577]